MIEYVVIIEHILLQEARHSGWILKIIYGTISAVTFQVWIFHIKPFQSFIYLFSDQVLLIPVLIGRDNMPGNIAAF